MHNLINVNKNYLWLAIIMGYDQKKDDDENYDAARLYY